MHDIEGANRRTDRATWISMLISIPAAVGLAVLSGPVTRLIFPGTNGVGGQLLILGGVTIILNGNSNITNGVLQGNRQAKASDDPCSDRSGSGCDRNGTASGIYESWSLYDRYCTDHICSSDVHSQ